MSMSLIITDQPFKSEFVNRFPHEFSPRRSLVKSQSSPNTRRHTPTLESSLQVSDLSAHEKMTTPHAHRGLPPMTLPDLNRPGPTSLSQPLGAMPAPPSQWQGQEDSMRNWLLAKAEEDKRKQEEERTRQESLKLEQRKIEQSMLRESLQGGIPPTMVPLIYAGIGGGNLANVSVDWLQQYTGQLQLAHQQQVQQASPDMHRGEGRLIGPPTHPGPSVYPAAQPTPQQVLQSHMPEQQPPPPPGPIQTTFSAYQPTPLRQPPTSDPRSATRTQLPRLTTNEMYVHQPPQPVAASVHPLQQSQTVQQQAQQATSSPSIYFHHWVPPNEARNNPQPQTPASKAESQHSAHPSSSNHGESEHRESPRKRKAQGGHQANPPPSAGPQYTSPSFSTTSSASYRKGGQRSRAFSNVSAAGRESDSRHGSRPPSSHRRDEVPTARSSQLSDQGPVNHQVSRDGAEDQRQEEVLPEVKPPRPASSDGRESREYTEQPQTASS
ncbi:uncharacterized protein RCC_00498 [Ramularia collo-cygni]|uniref:Uncharacterized protein n=1 Tax=Ramularia collo-cygni TaxID=112498 RepID=A0A2D3ULZ1_9PEZI|nr:uncharacterized protein RCC_00498 [Ramularia collo-cygni]CZT14521.1 uncharacterized protein RCC_00498 [Ramularia collo-cygni]